MRVEGANLGNRSFARDNDKINARAENICWVNETFEPNGVAENAIFGGLSQIVLP